MSLTQERLKELLHYNSHTGIFTWVVNRGRLAKSGNIAGTPHKDGYVHIRIDGKKYLAHRLAFLYIIGNFPEKLADHKNGIRDDNSWGNLREIDAAGNSENVHTVKRGTKSRYLGVSLVSKSEKYQARIKINGKALHLGSFDTPELAHKAYIDAKRKYHTHCTI